jgi:hypothetical protein
VSLSYCCPHPDHQDDDLSTVELLLIHVLTHLILLETTVSSNQERLDTDIAAIGTALSTIVAELKAQAANGQTLDFSAADALVASAQGEAAADAPAAPVAPAAQADGSTPPAV